MNAPGHIEIETGRFVAKSFTPLKARLIDLGYSVSRIKPQWGPWGFKGILLIQFGTSAAHAQSAFKLDMMFQLKGHGRSDWVGPNRSTVEPYLWVATDEDAALLRNTVDYVQVPYATIFDGQQLASS